MNTKQHESLSKFLALLLRHRAPEYGLALDPEGFVPVDDVLAVINRERSWKTVQRIDIEELIVTQQKRRYEIVGDDIRAIYGHSLATEVTYAPIVPPATLLHGTPRRSAEAIRREGLRPMQRQYVHLSDDPALAERTGKRRDPQPTIIAIDAARAHADGIVFYQADNGVFLCKFVPPEYVKD